MPCEESDSDGEVEGSSGEEGEEEQESGSGSDWEGGEQGEAVAPARQSMRDGMVADAVEIDAFSDLPDPGNSLGGGVRKRSRAGCWFCEC